MVEEGAAQGENEPRAATPSAFDAAVAEFLAYLKGYRHYSPWTVRAYGIDLREFSEFLLEQEGRVPAPAEITRPQVVAWGIQLKGMKPLTIRRKYACLSSFFSFLQDMGHCQSNPARSLPLPKVSGNLPTVTSTSMVKGTCVPVCRSPPPASEKPQTKPGGFGAVLPAADQCVRAVFIRQDINLRTRRTVSLMGTGYVSDICQLHRCPWTMDFPRYSMPMRILRMRKGMDTL